MDLGIRNDDIDIESKLEAVRVAARIIMDEGGGADVIIHRSVEGDHIVDEKSRECFCRPVSVPAERLAEMTNYEVVRLMAVHEATER